MNPVDDPDFPKAKHIACSKADHFLKHIVGDAHHDTGEADAPGGYVARMEITTEDLVEYGTPWLYDARNFATGWYLIKIDDAGFVWGLSYGDDEQGAIDDFTKIEDAYLEWHSNLLSP